MTYLIELLGQYGAWLVFAWVLLEQAGVPLPAYPVLMVAGSLAAVGQLSLPLLLAVTVLACLISDFGWYLAGGRYGGRVLRTICRLSLTPDSCVSQTESVFDRWGARSLIVAKFVPGFASVATAMAGATRVRRGAFLAYDFVGSTLWAGLGLALGWLFAPAVETLLNTLQSLGHWGLLLLAGAIAIYVARKAWNRVSFRRQQRMQRLSIAELSQLREGSAELVLVDVRKRPLWERERIPGSVFFDASEWESASTSARRDATIVVYCDCPAEASAVVVARALREKGFRQVHPLGGGLEGWRQAGFALQEGAEAP
ncbi:sulfurtransferase [Xylophilus rhododendri]|uniref:Sulfurtransferase n=1 Tax=Xylophilus rhododendri TaxID=2697032 RepID=A0A857JAY5_9BURK|nr:rhodanese-like domain-containing protein [Xylophilus rhododendri]QHJ00364.1 sulfurtransferase [Xylophilus rhododendri]